MFTILTDIANPPISQPAGFPATSAPPQQQAPAGPAGPAGFQPNYDILSSLSASQPQSQASTSVPGFSQPPQTQQSPQPTWQQQQQPQKQQQTTTTTADPFAALVSAGSRGSSPFAAATNRTSTPMATGGAQTQAAAASSSTDDDEWNFTSSLPDSKALPSSNKVVVLDSSLRIEFVARRHPNQPRHIHIVGMFSNRSSQQIVEIHFQVAVSKVP